MQRWCNLAPKETGLEHACMNNDNFTLLVSGGSRHCWVSLCIVWPLHSKWLNEQSNQSASNVVLSLNIPLWKVFRWFRRPQLWATGDWQLRHNNTPAHASHLMQFFCETSNHSGDSAPLQPIFGALHLLAFPKIKITFEREEISDCQWGKYNGAADGNWENRMRPHGAYFEGDWGVIILRTMFLVSSSINVSIFSYHIPEYLLEIPHTILQNNLFIKNNNNKFKSNQPFDIMQKKNLDEWILCFLPIFYHADTSLDL